MMNSWQPAARAAAFDLRLGRARFRATDIPRDRLVEDHDLLADESNQIHEDR